MSKNLLWQQMLLRVNPRLAFHDILCIDPGETTGIAQFKNAELIVAFEWDTKSERNAFSFFGWITEFALPDIIVMEEYRIYEHKAMAHAHSTIPTLRYIGAIQMLAFQQNIPVVFQSANRAKSFCTDQKLSEWNMLYKSQHANDAIRHGCAFYLFSDEAKKGITT